MTNNCDLPIQFYLVMMFVIDCNAIHASEL
jgi:hypothetical protein